jgi:hypothetical protein
MALYRIWFGHSTLSEAIRNGHVELEGVPSDVRAFPRWFAFSPLANVVRAIRAE